MGLEAIYTLRSLWRQRFYSVAVLLTMGLGLGASAVLASVMDALYLQPLAYAEGERIALSTEPWQPAGGAGDRAAAPVFAAVAGYRAGEGSILVGTEALRIRMAAVTPSFFEVFRDAPIRGRTLSGADGTTDEAVVISGRLAAMLPPGASSVVVHGVRRDIVGVLPTAFEFPSRADLWILHDAVPIGFYNGARYLNTVARLAPGATIEAARGTLRRDGTDRSPSLVSLRETLHRDLGDKLALSEWMAALLLALSWVAVLHSQVLRVSGRAAEFATRVALGARLRHLIGLVWLESMALYGGGVLVALALAVLSTPYVSRALPERVAQTLSIHVSWTTILATAGLALACASAGSLVTGLRLRRLSNGVVGGSASRVVESQSMSAGKASMGLVGLQVAFTTAAVVCSLLLWQSFARVVGTELGLLPSGLVAFRAELPPGDAARTLVPRLEAALRSEPSVSSAGSTSHLPLRDVGGFLVPARRGDQAASEALPVHFRAVSAGYFATVGTTVLEGRIPAPEGSGDVRQVVVNDRLARLLWPSGSAVGRQLWLPFDRNQPFVEVTGVTAGVKHFGLTEEVEPEVFVPLERGQLPVMTVVFRTQEPFDAAVLRVRTLAGRVAPGVTVFDFARVEDVLSSSYRDRQLQSLLALAVTAVALLVAFTTLFAVVGLLLRSRTREVAIRLALGASRTSVLRNVGRTAALATVAGLAGGLGLAWVAGRYLQSLLYQLKSSDPTSFVGATLIVATCAVIAAMEATRRCTRADVLSTLR